MTVRKSQTYDNLLLMKDAGAVAATGAAQVGGSARVLDVGLADVGDVRVIVDVSALTGTGTYEVAIQGSVDQAFTTPVQLGAVKPSATGRAEVKFTNNQAGTLYRYLRAFLTLGGTSPSVNCTIFLAMD